MQKEYINLKMTKIKNWQNQNLKLKKLFMTKFYFEGCL